jgi:ABC-type transport system involved in multi-copper enzyme maturation permease subunit
MFWEFFRFEARYWLRSWMLYIFIAVMALMFAAAAISDDIQVGQAIGNTFRNAPYVIQNFYLMASIIMVLMLTPFIDSAASRDFSNKSSELLFSKPISKQAFIHGRFLAAFLVSLLPILGVFLGVIVAQFYPGNDPEQWRSIDWLAHANSIIAFAIPNCFIFATVIFVISVLTRSTLYSFIGALSVLLFYGIAATFLSDLENEKLATLLDPLGNAAFGVTTKYWSVEERNQLSVGLSGMVLNNRLIWVGMAGILYLFGYSRFSFIERQHSAKKKNDAAIADMESCVPFRSEIKLANEGFLSEVGQFASQLRNDLRGVIRSTVFIVMMAACFLDVIPSLWFNRAEGYGNVSFPVTYFQIERIQSGMLIFLISIITFFSGVLVWRERDARLHEITGALPYPNWISYASKLCTLVIVIAIVYSCGIAVAVIGQLASGYTRIQLDVYIAELLLIDLTRMTFLAFLALGMHSIAANKYLGYFYFILILIANAFIWDIFRIDSIMVRYGRLPRYIYSDMYGFAPFTKGLIAFGIYWLLFCGILAWLTIRIMHRGVPQPLYDRGRKCLQGINGISIALLSLFVLGWMGVGGWLYYNTQVLNQPISSAEMERRQALYEKEYKWLETAAAPTISDVKYNIEIFPEQRRLSIKGEQKLVNKTGNTIDKLYLTLNTEYDSLVGIEGASLVKEDKELAFQEYQFDPPLAAGATARMEFDVTSKTRGIENQVTNIEVNQNGTFFNQSILPQIGYQADLEITDPANRRFYRLPKADGFPALSKDNPSLCMHHYAGASGWVNVETVIGTSGDQIAVAPGSLVEKWQENGRNYFKYKLDQPSLNFYSFISARYVVVRDKWNDVDVEVYYHPEHAWNVDTMKQAIRDALEYCSKNFGPYRHKQARIIEFPRFASYAQAFPGTMPYSESIGFIANLQDPEDIDFVYYVVCHEMAHQWWAHQVVGARMQGATLLSETLAQYSALMMMEKRYGREMMRKFLKYEMDIYLASRGSEFNDEKPLLNVNPDQGYIHYQKGSVVLYYLKEMIGEERINSVLKRLVEKYAYQDPPYPTAYDLVDGLREVMPQELHYLITDLFENITFFSNKVETATYTKQADGTYKVEMELILEKTTADAKGKTTPAKLNDWIEVGAYAKPESGKKYGKEIYRQRLLIEKSPQKVEFIVDQEPDEVGVDPHYLLIDRVTSDNMKTATLRQ